MTVAKKNEVLVPEVVSSIEINVNSDDIVAVGLAHAEEALNEQMAICKSRRQECQKETKKLQVAINKNLLELTDQKLGKHAQTLRTALIGLDFKAKVVIESPAYDKLMEVMKGAAWDKSLDVDIHVSDTNKNGYGRQTLDTMSSVKVSSAIIAKAKKLHETTSLLGAAGHDLRDVAARLGQLPMLERQLRARLATDRLEQTKQGRDLVDAMTKNILKKVKALPGVVG